MARDSFIAALKEAELEKYADFIESLFSPALQINHIKSEGKGIESCIGGTPKLPINFDWPKHERGLHTLVLTLDCSEIPENLNLPSDGVLYFFAAHDPDGDSWFWEDNFIKIFYFQKSELVSSPNIEIPVFARVPISFECKSDLPFNTMLREDWPWPEEDNDLFEYTLPECLDMNLVDGSKDFLLGYTPGSRLAYNPMPDESWQLLAFIRSNYEIEMGWADDSALMVFIEKEALMNKDFSNIKCEI